MADDFDPPASGPPLWLGRAAHREPWDYWRPGLVGKVAKGEVGAWVLKAFALMARFKGLRGTWLDPFRDNAERRLDRALLERYEADLERALQGLDAANLPVAAKIAALPETIRGYGHVKAANAEKAAKVSAALWIDWNQVVQAGQAGAGARAA